MTLDHYVNSLLEKVGGGSLSPERVKEINEVKSRLPEGQAEHLSLVVENVQARSRVATQPVPFPHYPLLD